MKMDSKSLSVDHFKNICRICLKIFPNMFLLSTENICNMLEECASVENSSNEKLPQQICDSCLLQLKSSYEFKQKCISSIELLLKILNSHEIEPIFETPNLKEESDGESKFNETPFESVFDDPNDDIKSEVDEKNNDFCNNDESEYSDNENHEKTEVVVETKAQKQKSVAELLQKKYNIYGLTCNICNKDLSNRFSMLRHMEVHDQNRTLKYNCKTCNKGFYALENLKKHEVRHLGKTKYQCDKCPKRFYVLSALGVHCKSSHKAQPIICPKCDLRFYHQLQIDQHLPVHEERKYVCEDCGKVFPTRNRLSKHKKIHSDERPYKCDMCESAFKQKFNLTIHQKLRHLESDRREMCNVCGKLFHPGSLRAHLETHNTDQIHKCDHCDKVYANRIILGKHINQKHKNGNEKKYYCNICNKALGSSGSLRKHLVVMHTTLEKSECHICGKSYKSQNGVKVHILSAHMDERPHICDICNKAFHSKNVLEKHMRTHTGERPFACDICGKSFGFKQVLKTHMKVHSK